MTEQELEKRYKMLFLLLGEDNVEDLKSRYKEIDMEAFSQFGYAFPDVPDQRVYCISTQPIKERIND